MLSVKRMIIDDLDTIIHIENSVFLNPWSRASFENMLNYDSLVLLQDETIVGYICCICVLDECSIANIAIAPTYQNKGYGKWLLTFIINSMKEQGINVFYLEARHSNERAITLYERIGFCRLAIRKNYYTNPQEDAIVMAYTIDPDHFRKTTWNSYEGL